MSPDALTRDFGGIPELRLDPNVPVRVFRPTPGQTPKMHPTLRLLTEPPRATLGTTWQIGLTRAEASGVIHWIGKDATPLVEFLLPGVKVVEVRGAEVTSWAQVGSRTQVWFRRPVREGEIEWIGTAAVRNREFDAPAPRVEEMHLLGDTLRIQATEGHASRVERDRGWTNLRPSTDGTIVFSTTNLAAHPFACASSRGSSPPAKCFRAATAIPAAADAACRRPRSASADNRAGRRSASVTRCPRWVWPVSVAIGWLAATIVLAVLLLRFPHSTWPEQFGIVVGLWGAALFGLWWLGIIAWMLRA